MGTPATNPVQVKIDTTRFDNAFKLYVEHTSKTVVDAVNFKLYDAARAAIKGTPIAKKSDIATSLNEICSIYPNRTVAQMLVIKHKQETGEDVYDLEEEVKDLKSKRNMAIGFTRSGWLPALRKLLSYIGKEFVNVSNVSHKPSYGGAIPAVQLGSIVEGSVYNDVTGKINGPLVESLKEKGAQAGFDKVAGDMEKYLLDKFNINTDSFNRS